MPLGRILNTALIVVSILTVVLLVFAIRTKISDISVTLPEPALHNVYYPQKTDEKSFRYYTGNTFVSYNNENGQITPLTNLLSIYDVQNTYWYNEGVLFNVSNMSETSDLSILYDAFLTELSATGDESQLDALNTDLVYWNLSFSSGKISPVGLFVENELQGIQSKDGGFVFNNLQSFSKINPNGEFIRSYIPFFGSEDIDLLYADSDYIYYVEKLDDRFNILRYSIALNKSEIILEDLYKGTSASISQPIYMLDDKSIFHLLNSGVVGGVGIYDLVQYNLETKKGRVLAENVQGFMKKSGSSHITYVHLGREVVEVYLASNDGLLNTYRLDNTANLVDDSFTLNDTLIPFEANGKAYNLTRGESKKINPRDFALEKEYKSQEASLIRNILTTNDMSYTLTVVSGSVADQRNKLFTYIEKQGLNPYEFTIVTVKGQRATD